MEKIKLISDSTCDLTPEQVKTMDIEIVPAEIILGTETHTDGVDIVPKDVLDFYDRTGMLPKTSAINSERYKQVFSRYLAQGYKIIHFDISSKASAMHVNAKAAAQELGGDIYVVDSKSLSSGQGLLIMKTYDMMQEGKTYEEICEALKVLPDKVQTSFVVDTLEFLHKGGRCSLAALMGAKLLKLHPYVAMFDGQLKAKKKYAGNMPRCLNSYIRDLASEYTSYDRTRCFITHTLADQELVDQVINLTKELFSFDEVLESVAGCTVTSHCGYNTIGLLFITE